MDVSIEKDASSSNESMTAPASDRVQIKADKTEIQRRIAAFMTRKRKETDELNLQEFCNLPRAEMASEFSCARVDTVVIPRAGSKGHVKVSKVVNEWGPQTMPAKLQGLSARSTVETGRDESVSQLPEGIEERLTNMETHLNISAGKPVPKNIYERLRNLEDRILFLESLSPDYFVDLPQKLFRSPETIKRQRLQQIRKKDLTLDEIDARIEMLRTGLLKQSTGQQS